MGQIKENRHSAYMPGLDGLRTLAVFAVVAYHLDVSWMQGGLLGVNLFFVLSGYLITNILMNQWADRGIIDLKDFWIRRARRLLPALFTMLAGVLLWLAFFAPERLAALKWEALAATFYTSNWYLIFHEVSYFESFGPASPLGHLWSLAIEEQFYLLWPIFVGLGLRCFKGKKGLIRGTVAIAVISAVAMALIYMPGQDPSRVYYGTDTRVFALLVGAVSAMIWPARKANSDLKGKRRIALEGIGGAGLLVLLLMMVKTNQYQPFLYQGGLLIFSMVTALVVMAIAHPASRIGKIFGWRPLRWLGESSYGIYLWHYPVIVLTSPVVRTGEANLLHIIWQVAVTLLLATVSRYLIEEPIRYGGWQFAPEGKKIPSSWRNSPALGLRIFVSLLLVFSVVFATVNDSIPTSAKDLTAYEEEAKQGQETDVKLPEEIEVKVPDKELEAEPSAEAGAEEQKPDGEGLAEKPKTHEAGDKNDLAFLADMASQIDGGDVTIISDSIIINATPLMEELLPGITIDGKISRQMHQAPEVIDGLKKSGKLKKTVILGLGTNGAFTEKQLVKVLDSLSDAEEIILVNIRVPRPWEAVVNETLAKTLEAYPDIRLVDWYTVSKGRDDYFKSDGVHLNESGVKAYAEMILEELSSSENQTQ